MPIFEMEGKHEPDFRALDDFTQGYVEALFWTQGGDEESELGDTGFMDMSPMSILKAKQDCARFQQTAKTLLAQAYGKPISGGKEYDAAHAGHDFWLTRNGHGVGFWDRGFENALGEALSDVAEAFGGSDAHLGDDGKVYL